MQAVELDESVMQSVGEMYDLGQIVSLSSRFLIITQ